MRGHKEGDPGSASDHETHSTKSPLEPDEKPGNNGEHRTSEEEKSQVSKSDLQAQSRCLEYPSRGKDYE
ncbi:MAG: hypothetical protein ACE5FB_08485 [Candidatus Binatia bacterium]